MLLWINELPEDSQTKTEMRNGDWTEERYILARIANELMMSRADSAANVGVTQQHSLIQSPQQLWQQQFERAQSRYAHDLIHDQISGRVKLPPRAISVIRETDVDQKREARQEAAIANRRV